MANINKIIILRGLPGSGKTTNALQFVKRGFKRISEADLRWSIDDGSLSKSNNLLLNEIQHIIITICLQSNYSVILDNCNLNPNDYKYVRFLAQEYRADLEFINFDTPLSICLERDLERTHGRVGKDVIMSLYNTYFKDGKFPSEE